MLTPEERATAASMTRVMQIIVIALVAGVSSYLAFALLNRAPPEQHPFAAGGAAFAAAALVGAMIIPSVMAGQQRTAIATGASAPAAGSDDAGQLLAGLQTRKIIGTALLEGAAFLNVFVYQTGGPAFSLGIVVALILAMVLHFPLHRLVEEWLDRELRTVRELRELHQ